MTRARTAAATAGRKVAPGGKRRARLAVSRAPAKAGEPPGPVWEPEHALSPTAVAAAALRTGVVPHAVARSRDDATLPGEAERIRVGDPDDQALLNEYVGEDTPGGSTPTPDQGNVDDIGRVYGLQDEDSGELRTSAEVMAGRDRRRLGLSVRRRRS